MEIWGPFKIAKSNFFFKHKDPITNAHFTANPPAQSERVKWPGRLKSLRYKWPFYMTRLRSSKGGKSLCRKNLSLSPRQARSGLGGSGGEKVDVCPGLAAGKVPKSCSSSTVLVTLKGIPVGGRRFLHVGEYYGSARFIFFLLPNFFHGPVSSDWTFKT